MFNLSSFQKLFGFFNANFIVGSLDNAPWNATMKSYSIQLPYTIAKKKQEKELNNEG